MVKSILLRLAEHLISLSLKPLIYFRRMAALKRRGWYKNMASGMCSPHCEVIINRKEISRMDEGEFWELLGIRR